MYQLFRVCSRRENGGMRYDLHPHPISTHGRGVQIPGAQTIGPETQHLFLMGAVQKVGLNIVTRWHYHITRWHYHISFVAILKTYINQ